MGRNEVPTLRLKLYAQTAQTCCSVPQSEWTADLEFRATGGDRGGGNLQIWYTKEGRPRAETPSIYTTAAFDGLALVVDMYGGRVRRLETIPILLS